jgi:hypothetical protein
MPYRIHFVDRHAKAVALADFMTTVPTEELTGLLDEAKIMLRDREFGNENYGRNSKPSDPYWFENKLIADAGRYIAEGKPLDAFMYCLTEHNHGHSGFTSQSYRVYMHPVNDTEREMSEKIRQMIVSVANALVNSDPLSRNVADLLGDGWLVISSAYSCLTMLGQDVPSELIDRLRGLLGDCNQFAQKNREILQLQHWFKHRFS